MRQPKRSEIETYVALRLPRELHDQLKKAGGERGFTNEVRRRLEASFAWEGPLGGDPKTHELTDAIAQVAQNLDNPFGAWHHDPFAFAALKTAVDLLLAYYQPKGKPVAKTPSPDSLAASLFGPDATPERVGKTLAAMALAAAGKKL